MALFDSQYPTMGPAGMAGRIGSVFVTAASAASDWQTRRVTRRRLSDLTDRELDDIGLTRADIEAAAHGRR